jgi:hypothetical protein
MPIVFDDLIDKGEMPLTITLLSNPGALPPQPRLRRRDVAL